MQYTLDSITHVKECLKEYLSIEEISIKPFLTTSLKELKEKKQDLFYFGVFNVGENISKLTPKLFNQELLNVTNNNQIIVLFDSLLIEKSDIKFPKGAFRGFLINCKSSVVTSPVYPDDLV